MFENITNERGKRVGAFLLMIIVCARPLMICATPAALSEIASCISFSCPVETGGRTQLLQLYVSSSSPVGLATTTTTTTLLLIITRPAKFRLLPDQRESRSRDQNPEGRYYKQTNTRKISTLAALARQHHLQVASSPVQTRVPPQPAFFWLNHRQISWLDVLVGRY